MHGSHTSLSPERKISRIEIHSEGKVGFRFPTILFYIMNTKSET